VSELTVVQAALYLELPTEEAQIGILELVREPVESIHAGQKKLIGEVRDIRRNLPIKRKPLSKRAMEIHIKASVVIRNGYCPVCAEIQVCQEIRQDRQRGVRPFFQPNQNLATDWKIKAVHALSPWQQRG
jgi:hypothetical protein